MEDLSQEGKGRMVRASITFMREVLAVYGPEEGARVWEDICLGMDPVLRNTILIDIMSGKYGNNVSIRPGTFSGNRVAFIKLLRANVAGHPGLKEAKDMVDSLLPMPYTSVSQVVKLDVVASEGVNVNEFIKELRALGLEVL